MYKHILVPKCVGVRDEGLLSKQNDNPVIVIMWNGNILMDYYLLTIWLRRVYFAGPSEDVCSPDPEIFPTEVIPNKIKKLKPQSKKAAAPPVVSSTVTVLEITA